MQLLNRFLGTLEFLNMPLEIIQILKIVTFYDFDAGICIISFFTELEPLICLMANIYSILSDTILL